MDYQIKDPSSLLQNWRDRNLQRFSEQLFMMFAASGAEEMAKAALTPPTFPRPGEGQEIRRDRAAEALGDLAGAVRATRLESERARTLPLHPVVASTPTAAATPQPRRPVPVPAPSAAVAPPRSPEIVRPREAPALPPGPPPGRPEPVAGPGAPGVTPLSDSRTKGFFPIEPLLDIGEWGTPPLVGRGSSVYLGKVDSGQGDTYQVYLYRSGPKGDPDQQTVTVTIPQIDPNEQIPKGTWFSGIIRMTDPNGNTIFVYQPPIWVQ